MHFHFIHLPDKKIVSNPEESISTLHINNITVNRVSQDQLNNQYL